MGDMRGPVELFQYQQSVIPEIDRKLAPGVAVLLVAPTGSGKTVIAAEVARGFNRPLFVAHRVEIVNQARAEMGGFAQCMSIQQALRHGPPSADLLIIDEAHRATASTYRQIISKYSNACILGMTATPRRTDGQGLIDVFSEIVQCSSVAELIEAGYLVPYQAFEAPDEALKQLPHMRRVMGDYSPKELAELVNRPRLVGDVVREYKKHGIGRKAIAFAVNIEHSMAMASAFVEAGVRAIHLDGRASAKVRANALKDLADGALDVLCSVNLFTEGWDCPSVSCVIMARPTASLTLYLQSVGRGMRTAQGKRDLLILDHAGNIERHGPPDMKREWALESEQQKAKREAEQAELERLWSLGYESIEAELEAKRREQEEIAREWMEASELLNLLRLLGMKADISPSGWAYRRGIEVRRSPRCRKNFLYRRSDVEAQLKVISAPCDKWLTFTDAVDLLKSEWKHLPETSFLKWIRWHKIPTKKSSLHGLHKLYEKSSILEAIKKQKRSAAAWMDRDELLACLKAAGKPFSSASLSVWFKANKIFRRPVPGNGKHKLYSRADVEAALAKRVSRDTTSP